jgi:hypothetical protein
MAKPVAKITLLPEAAARGDWPTSWRRPCSAETWCESARSSIIRARPVPVTEVRHFSTGYVPGDWPGSYDRWRTQSRGANESLRTSKETDNELRGVP